MPATLSMDMTPVEPLSFSFPTFATKAAREAWMKGKLAQAARWALWGVLTVHQYQTDLEKAVKATEEDNGVAFTGVDAAILSSFVGQWQEKGFLSPKQIALLQKKMPKYAAQLIGHLEAKGVTLAVDKSNPAALKMPETAEPAPVETADDGVTVTMTLTPAPATPAPAKTGKPDWSVWKPVKNLSHGWKDLVAKYIDQTDAAAKDVWSKVKDNPNGPTPGQAGLLAIACAKAAGGVA